MASEGRPPIRRVTPLSTQRDPFELPRVAQCYEEKKLLYRLDGNMPQGITYSPPTIVFVNDILVDLHVWDPLVQLLVQRFPSYCIFRYSEFSYPYGTPSRIVNFALNAAMCLQIYRYPWQEGLHRLCLKSYTRFARLWTGPIAQKFWNQT